MQLIVVKGKVKTKALNLINFSKKRYVIFFTVLNRKYGFHQLNEELAQIVKFA